MPISTMLIEAILLYRTVTQSVSKLPPPEQLAAFNTILDGDNFLTNRRVAEAFMNRIMNSIETLPDDIRQIFITNANMRIAERAFYLR